MVVSVDPSSAATNIQLGSTDDSGVPGFVSESQSKQNVASPGIIKLVSPLVPML